MKNITIKIDQAGVSFSLNRGEYEISIPLADLKKAIQENPELKEELAQEFMVAKLCEEVKTGYFLPKNGEYYWFFTSDGSILEERIDEERISVGVFRTEAEAETARDKQQALVRLWLYADNEMYFSPDWGNKEQIKYYVDGYDNDETKFIRDYTNNNFHSATNLPFFASQADVDKFISKNGRY